MRQRLLVLLMIVLNLTSFAQSRTVQGKVTSSSDQQPLPGVNVIVKGTTQGVSTDASGNFSILASEKDVLVFSFIGYTSQEINVGNQNVINISLTEDVTTLSEVMIYSTGYEQLPKERATGSFVKADNELINRKVSTNVLDRLEDVTSGLIFNRGGSATDPISIRGRSTLFANANPLIVIDNFPYDGDLSNINPNDVESITVLRDAAAASIWGARAGNGVIVITMKKGANRNAPKITFNSNVTVGEKIDPFYVPLMSTSDYIDTEKQLFSNGYYTSIENQLAHRAITPAVELLIANRDGLLSPEELDTKLHALKQRDVRNDYSKYLYQKSVNQQYAVNISGGSNQQTYFLSAGYDKNLGNLVGNQMDRFTLNAKNTWTLLRDRFIVSGDLYYTRTSNQNNGIDPYALKMTTYDPLYPYARFADNNGYALPVTQDYRESFKAQAESNGLLDWSYRPLQELNEIDRTTKNTDYRINTSLRYQIIPGLSADVLYQFWNSNIQGRNNYSEQSYFARNLVNQYTQEGATGLLTRPIPEGGILDVNNQAASSNNLRAQLNFSKTLGNHQINAIGGYEVKEVKTLGTRYRYYGYNDELANSSSVDYTTLFQQYYYQYGEARIPSNDGQFDLTDRFLSYYGNAAYTYRQRYTLSVSARKDQSNLFGVKANQKGVPLWSTGVSWNISEEPFYKISFLPYLKLRATYGYNGNIDKSVTAYTTAQTFGTNSITGLPYARIMNPPNPSLQWERIQIVNLGLDFEVVKNIVTGSIEYYQKNGSDLIGFAPIAPSTGLTRYKGNTASTRGNGFDITLNTNNINGAFKWQTNFLISASKLKVTSYKDEATTWYLLNYGYTGGYLREGNTLFGLYSYKSGGLDPTTGDPQGYVEGAVSKDYLQITQTTKPEEIVYHGSARPTNFGAIRNTFSWRNLSLSFNISYRLGYYFRRNSISYSNTLGLGGHGDYYKRWKNPGDEMRTDVPSLPTTFDANRDQFYLFSDALAEKGDHIRFQDIQLSYTLNQSSFGKLPFQRAQVYAYMNNIGILWKATDKVPDPDYLITPPLRTYSIGLKVDF
ncbi:MAG TPA: SusC/RagA family TonB-linked outer membrane protein [Cyclobacteriaceae bacterium]|nr:SusC/RagA family TonB-linked outer membrane protein [Cyclobacteriaceae bacterium]HMV08160.1 SusC/RagA family TonB-linked outer membrane protein [Cyclobacteriaceae bacterium]HMX00801.1 SusC/RagA family TonB-linked outer membrane protein [Cyclobacteriaceae bacterium]HMX49324.1 SusC/RagA family TonB-linked outer membrane protein [Cyclobacteriaceae bacterium]HMY93604.1 SusC/RagA family TonB-linked outer membrane protein [Cyclobacteriaceae bacterium]